MNIASLMNHPKARRATPTREPRLKLVRVQATVLAQGAVSAMKDSVQAFRHMRDVLTGGYAHRLQ
ncbi:hypothetical protein HPC49_38025 [Pyxidicoccus fallax]|uniref:Uncharacterized protein n=1 Tax=Pyxidicoccus fallax TaxID=394095 RepID=A0A848LUZ3_9BACT|nr:hypothetical protein [Pyxidicoccus fallax]NMO21815.1 hypothetical protein [Pyxidicoccus fallax]NPC84000.1 hypothetical protein [Pyxidicoccus fallax]